MAAAADRERAGLGAGTSPGGSGRTEREGAGRPMEEEAGRAAVSLGGTEGWLGGAAGAPTVGFVSSASESSSDDGIIARRLLGAAGAAAAAAGTATAAAGTAAGAAAAAAAGSCGAGSSSSSVRSMKVGMSCARSVAWELVSTALRPCAADAGETQTRGWGEGFEGGGG